jgi:hypothetical protein
MNQRWRHHRTLYRPADEVIRTVEYDVAPIDHESRSESLRSGPRDSASGFITAASLSEWQCSAIPATTSS